MLATTIITPAQVYWIARMDNISKAFQLVLIFSIIGSLGLLVAILINKVEREHENVEMLLPIAKRAIITTLLALIGMILTPTTKELCTVLLIPTIANNENAQGIGAEFYDLAKEWMQELKPTKGETK